MYATCCCASTQITNAIDELKLGEFSKIVNVYVMERKRETETKRMNDRTRRLAGAHR